MKQFSLKKGLVLGTALSAGLLAAGSAQAGATFKMDDTKWISIGAGIRSSFSAVEAGAPEAGSKWSNDFALDNARIYLNGQVHENIKFELNTESRYVGTTNEFFLLDAIAKFEFNDMVNIWVGRQLVPSDRAELDGPFYQNTFEFNKTPFFPNDQGSYTAGKFGRDDGINIWGALTDDKKLTYVVGVFNGTVGGPDQDDNLLYAGRVSYNFLNVEKNPGYYTSSTYYGNAGDILTLAFAAQWEEDAVGAAGNAGDFFGYSVDLLGETTLGNGAVVTVEGQFKKFNFDGDGYFDVNVTLHKIINKAANISIKEIHEPIIKLIDEPPKEEPQEEVKEITSTPEPQIQNEPEVEKKSNAWVYILIILIVIAIAAAIYVKKRNVTTQETKKKYQRTR